MRAAAGRALPAPGAIAQIRRRVDMPKSLVIGRARVADIG
jgi:hypothetical protein